MTITLKQIRELIKKYRNLFRADKSAPLVKVLDNDLESRNIAPSQKFDAHLPDESVLTDVHPEITVRPSPDEDRSYNSNAGSGSETIPDADIDLSRDDYLETYANGMRITPETLQKWIAAGILYPDEIRAAEKLLKMIRKKKRLDIRRRKI